MPLGAPPLGGPDGDRFGKPDHAVVHRGSAGRFALLGQETLSPESRPDEGPVPADRSLSETTSAGACVTLPCHAAPLDDAPDTLVTPAGGRRLPVLRHCRGTWRDG